MKIGATYDGGGTNFALFSENAEKVAAEVKGIALHADVTDEEAIKAVEQWRFEPGRRSGVPVDVLVTEQPAGT